MVGLACEGLVHLLKQRHVRQGRFAENLFPRRNVSFGKRLSGGSDLYIAAAGCYKRQ